MMAASNNSNSASESLDDAELELEKGPVVEDDTLSPLLRQLPKTKQQPTQTTTADSDSSSDAAGGLFEKISLSVDRFFSPDGTTLPRVSMLTNLGHLLWPSLAAALAIPVLNLLFFSDFAYDAFGFYAGYRTKVLVRVSAVAVIYVGSALYVLVIKRVPSGAALAVGGVHAFLMNQDVRLPFWWCRPFLLAWVVATAWALGAGVYLYENPRNPDPTHTTATKTTTKERYDFCRGVALWSLYANLACLSLPNLTGFGSPHNAALLARAALLVAGHLLGHPTFTMLGWVASAHMVLAFWFPSWSFFEQAADLYVEGVRHSFWL